MLVLVAGICLSRAGELDHAEGGIAGFGVAGVLLFVGLEFARGLVARAQALHHDASRAVLDDVYPHELAERLVSSAVRAPLLLLRPPPSLLLQLTRVPRWLYLR